MALNGYQKNECRGAVLEHKAASLASEFGEKMLASKFADELASIEAIVGRYTRGARVGKLRGEVCWVKVTEGGWDYSGSHGVLYRGAQFWTVRLDGYVVAGKPYELRAQWHPKRYEQQAA